MKIPNLIIFFCLVLVFNSCNKPDLHTERDQKQFPNLPAFFKAEAERLSSIKGLNVLKTTVYNNKKQSKTMKIEDWAEELAIFSRYKIHEPAQSPYYKLSQNGNIVSFETEETAMPVKKLTIEYSDIQHKKIKQLTLDVVQNNEVYGNKMNLLYDTENGYRIRKNQKIILFAEDIFEVNLQFQPLSK